MPTTLPPTFPDQLTLLLELLDGIAHDLGSTAGGLRMRATALRLGAPAAGAEGTMHSAATGLACTQLALRLLMGLQSPLQGPSGVVGTQWLEAMGALLPTMLGPGYRVEWAACNVPLSATVVSGLSASVLAHAREFRDEPRTAGMVRPVDLGVSLIDEGVQVWLETSSAAAVDDIPAMRASNARYAPGAWIRLSERIASEHALDVERMGARTFWKSASARSDAPNHRGQ